jgi:hypothetical protein
MAVIKSRMAMNDCIAKVFPIFLYPRMRNGIFKTKRNNSMGHLSVLYNRMDIPVIPPSRNSLGINKPFKATTAEATPKTRYNKLLNENICFHKIG